MLTDREVGTVVLTRLDDGRVRVDQADPIIHISVELLAEHTNGLVIDGDLVTFGDINPVTYRITERDARVVEAERA